MSKLIFKLKLHLSRIGVIKVHHKNFAKLQSITAWDNAIPPKKYVLVSHPFLTSLIGLIIKLGFYSVIADSTSTFYLFTSLAIVKHKSNELIQKIHKLAS